MKRETIVVAFVVFITILILLVVIFYVMQALGLGPTALQQFSNMTEEKQELINATKYKSLETFETDTPEIIAYKLFKNFDPLFLNETKDQKTIYNPFYLDLKGKAYDVANGNLTNKVKEGIIEFSETNNLYQIGVDTFQQPPDCSIDPDFNIDFYNGCWSGGMDNRLDELPNPPLIGKKPCLIYYSPTGVFNNRVKIRVGWYRTSSYSSNNREVIYILVTICDG